MNDYSILYLKFQRNYSIPSNARINEVIKIYLLEMNIPEKYKDN